MGVPSGEKIAFGFKNEANVFLQHFGQVFVKPDLTIARLTFGAALVTGNAALFNPFRSVAEIHICVCVGGRLAVY